jgi:hypothetical protein
MLLLTRAAFAADAPSATSPAGSDKAAETIPGTHASVIALNQKPQNSSVSITYAYLPKDGSLVIYSGNPGKNQNAKELGQVSLTAGDHRDVSVKPNSAPRSGTQLWAGVAPGKSEQPFTSFGKPAGQSFKIL